MDGHDTNCYLKVETIFNSVRSEIPTKLLSGLEHRLAVYSSLVALFGELPIPVGRVEFRRVKRTKRHFCVMGGLTQSWRSCANTNPNNPPCLPPSPTIPTPHLHRMLLPFASP